MGALRKLLLPVDFSERSAGAVRYTRALAGRFHSEVTLIHVLTPPHYEFGALEIGGSMLTELYNSRAGQVQAELDAFDLPGVEVRRVVLEGDPARKIVEYAHNNAVDLIVMPTHGYGPFRQFILGSITAKVLHDADCPVSTGVHMEEAPVREYEFRRILCAIDLGPQSCRTVEWARNFQKEIGAELTLLHVTTCIEDPRGQTPGQDWRADIEREARQELNRIQQQFDMQVELMLESGDPPHMICAAATRAGADLLVIGRGSAAGVFGRLRTNAYAVIRQSPCPVVSV